MDPNVDVVNANRTLSVSKGARFCISSTSSEENDGENSEYKKRERRRNKIIQEILNTEKTYQNHLELVVKYFEEPMRKLKLVPDHVIVTMFSNIKQIININKELCQHLKVHPIGKAFLLIGPFLKLYSTYANNHERALATLMEWDQKSPEFSVFRRRQEDSEEFCGLKLNALLITPVQRVPRYKLLLEDLLHHTDRVHEDYNSLEEACRQISAVAQHINEHIKQQDNFMKMLAIQKSLVGPLAPKILTPGRMFIKDGRLKKVSKNGGRSYERMFFLFSDILMYAKPKLLESGSLHSYNCCCIYPLHHCTVNRVFGHSQGHGALFTIQCKGESLLLYSDQKVVDLWIKALNLAIGKFVENRQSLRKESSAKMPVRRGALAKYKKEQELSDPLAGAKKTPPNSPFNNKAAKSPKTPKGFLKRTLKESNVTGSPSTPSPKRKQNQEAFMKTLWCLTPKGGRRKKYSEEESGYENADLENTSDMVISSPQVVRNNNDTGVDNFIGLEPSLVWKGGEDSTYMEQTTLETSKDCPNTPNHSHHADENITTKLNQGQYPSPITNSKTLEAIREENHIRNTSILQSEFADAVSFPPFLHEEHKVPSASGVSLSSEDFDREKIRSGPFSSGHEGHSVLSAISIIHDNNKQIKFPPVFNSESDSDNPDSAKMNVCHRKRKAIHSSFNSSPRSSNTSEVANSSFSTSMGELNEDSLRSLSHQYSQVMDGNTQSMSGDLSDSSNEDNCHSEELLTAGSSRYVHSMIGNGFSPIKHAGSMHQSSRKYQIPSSSSPVVKLQNNNLSGHSDHRQKEDQVTQKILHDSDKSQTMQMSNDNILNFQSNNLCSTDSMRQLKGWTTCYTKLKTLPGCSEIEIDDTSNLSNVNESFSDNAKLSNKKGKINKDKNNYQREEFTLSDTDEKTQSGELTSSWSKALEAANYTSKLVYDMDKPPYNYGPGCVVQ